MTLIRRFDPCLTSDDLSSWYAQIFQGICHQNWSIRWQSRAIFRFCSLCSKAPPRDCRTSKLWFKNIRIKGFQMRYYSSGFLNKMTSKTYRNLLQFLKSFLLYLVWFFKNFKLKSKQNSIISILLHKMEIWKKVLFELECSRVI